MVKKWIAAFAAVICSFLGIYNYGEEQIAQGYVLMEEGDYAAAGEQFEAAIAQAAESSEKKEDKEAKEYVVTEAYRGLGMAAFEMQEYQNCIEYLQNAIDEGAEPTVVMYNLMGISSMELEDYDTALVYFEQGTSLQKTVGDASEEDAEQHFEDIYKEIRFNKIVCYEQLQDWENAKLEAEEYVKLYPEDEAIQKEYTFLKTR